MSISDKLEIMAENMPKVYKAGWSNKHNTTLAILNRSITSLDVEDLKGLTFIGGYAFYGCNKLTTAKLPEGITELRGAVFLNCTALNSIKLPTSLAAIQANAFQGCTALIEMTIPANVTQISSNALKIGTTTNKASIIFESITPPTIAASTFDFNTLEKIIVPQGTLDAYINETNWANVANNVQIVEKEV